MERDVEHGRRKFYLTARQAGEIARAANAGSIIPMHFSPRAVPARKGHCCVPKQRRHLVAYL
jgi:ribonuclease BN (tRNA processing enzyme)